MSTSLGEHIRLRRIEEGVSQRDLAASLGVSAAHLCDIEQGKRMPSDALLERIVDKLGGNLEQTIYWWLADRIPPDMRGDRAVWEAFQAIRAASKP